MESLMEKVLLYDKPVEFSSRTYGDASLTEMLCKEWKPDKGPMFGSGQILAPMGPMLEQPTFKEKEIEGPGCVGRNQYELEGNWNLQERFDYSGHNGYGPHTNYELVNPQGSVIKPIGALKNFFKDIHQVDLPEIN